MTAILLDTETTGLREPEPVEVAYLRLNELDTYSELLNFQQYDKFCERFRPSKAIEPGASKIHGIHLSDVAHSEYWKFEQLELTPESFDYLIGHNISYDINSLSFKRPELKELLKEKKVICTLKLVRRLFPEYKADGGYSLSNLMSKMFPVIQEALKTYAHGALADCYFTLCIIWKITVEHGIESWEELYDLQN